MIEKRSLDNFKATFIGRCFDNFKAALADRLATSRRISFKKGCVLILKRTRRRCEIRDEDTI